jgi:hypothetical protein
MGRYMLQVPLNENKCIQELQQDFLQVGSHYLCVKRPYFLIICAGQDGHILVI